MAEGLVRWAGWRSLAGTQPGEEATFFPFIVLSMRFMLDVVARVIQPSIHSVVNGCNPLWVLGSNFTLCH